MDKGLDKLVVSIPIEGFEPVRVVMVEPSHWMDLQRRVERLEQVARAMADGNTPINPDVVWAETAEVKTLMEDAERGARTMAEWFGGGDR